MGVIKHVIFLIFFTVLSINVHASWQTYQNDLRNTGASAETGFFPLTTANFSDNSLGMDFQPLVDDLDASGSSEIAIFSNDSLVIFNPQLNILAQSKVGSLLGQPTLYNFDNDNSVEIMFNARQNQNDYFFAYQYSNNILQQEFNITLQNEANFSGIKCLKINGVNSCVFKDRRNYINIVDLDLKTGNFYNTSVFNETKQSVPAIGDIDTDGKEDAVFWFNKDGSGPYGFLAFDLVDRKVKWIVDDIFSPRGVAPGLDQFVLKGQPVLADLNNDKKLEIAGSVFYDDAFNFDLTSDWFTEIHVYSYNGSKLFSKCEIGISSCNDGTSTRSMWGGTNPFAMDFDKNGIDDICFIKDKKLGGYFDYMAMNCYNYNGNEIAKVNLTLNEGVGTGNAMTADMNNDGKMDVITTNNIYSIINSTASKVLLNMPSLERFHPIAVDIDGNNGLDLIWTIKNKTKVFLDNNVYTVDLSVSDITFSKTDDSRVNVTATIRNSGNLKANNVKIAAYNTETLENNTITTNINGNSNFTFSSLLNLNEGDNVLVNVDYDNEITETDETNNFASKEFNGLPYVFVYPQLEPFNVESEFKDYIKNKLTSGYYTEKESEADVKVYIGKNNPRNIESNPRLLNEFDIGYDYGNIIYNDETASNPYAGLIAAFKEDVFIGEDILKIMIVGNDIDGDIAAAKEFIKNQALLLNTEDFNSIFIDDENPDAIKVYDYLHLDGNKDNYKLSNNAFRNIVRNALNDEMFTIEDKTVATNNGIVLRLRNLKPGVSSDYLEYLSSSGVPVELPVVLAHGIFSNLTTWEVLGSELSNTGRDTWLIEITGGPNQDCDNCVDYTFDDLTNDYVPALLNGVLSFTGKNNLQYVGFSNGCRAALDSLERNQFDSNKVETFVGVACPGAFEELSLVDSGILLVDDIVIKNIQDKNINHVDVGDLFKFGLLNKNVITNEETGKISLNLWKDYLFFMSSSNDTQPGKIIIPKFGIIQGNALGKSDGIVPTIDEDSIYSNVKLRPSTNNNINPIKQSFKVLALHSNLDTTQKSKTLIRKLLNNEDLSFFEKAFNLINQSSVVG